MNSRMCLFAPPTHPTEIHFDHLPSPTPDSTPNTTPTRTHMHTFTHYCTHPTRVIRVLVRKTANTVAQPICLCERTMFLLEVTLKQTYNLIMCTETHLLNTVLRHVHSSVCTALSFLVCPMIQYSARKFCAALRKADSLKLVNFRAAAAIAIAFSVSHCVGCHLRSSHRCSLHTQLGN